MHNSLVRLKASVFGNNLTEASHAIDPCLHDILDQYDHSQMTVFTRLMEMLLDTDISDKASKALKIVDLVKFPIKKAME
ncbi:hypothetical protein EHEL_020775 [Encephalitozoon hellem ATCC 50504]|uniref:Uncharacterized protein n=1 Tax=Encephalitozoon hellem TaxID=27973 RepID=A0A9Q9C205_ENCHE|nr:uncharacterized protein EHEL_020775 [Encephalitozoon hellem ATCC 50504]AHL28912.1 hypothetical protein EHEL_020775 [Encephalitozoon hellem ATCC 50504]UTX42611.1 hypothetical protein GPU96_02g03230 [Encephalitozoon hellem]